MRFCASFLAQTCIYCRPEPAVVLALLDAEDAPLDEMLGTALQFGKQAVCYCNEAMKQTVEEDAF